MENYWHLILWDGEIIKIKPDNVANVQHKIDNKLDVKMMTRTVIYKNIKDFVESAETYTDHKLLEAEAFSAFGEPKITKDGIATRWVKKNVPRREWTKYYSVSPGYRMLEDNDNYITIAFLLPLHEIDTKRVEMVTGMQLAKLT